MNEVVKFHLFVIICDDAALDVCGRTVHGDSLYIYSGYPRLASMMCGLHTTKFEVEISKF